MAHKKQIGFSILTQGLASLSNFVVGVSLMRYSDKTQYGLFSVLYSIVDMLKNFQNALSNAPLTITFNTLAGPERRVFVGGIAAVQVAVFGALAGAAIFIGAFIQVVFPGQAILLATLVTVISSLAFLGREFLRALGFTTLRIGVVFIMDIVFAIACIALLGLLLVLRRLTAITALLALALGYTASAGLAYKQLRAEWTFCRGAGIDSFRQTWRYSKWALAGVTAGILQSRVYVYFTTAVIGLVGVADVSAARFLLLPVSLLVSSTSRIVIAKGSALHAASDWRSLRKLVFSIMLLLLIGSTIYMATLWLFYGRIISLLGGRYQGIEQIALLWAGYFVVNAIRVPLTDWLVVLKDFRRLAINDVPAVAITLGLCVPLMRIMGARGAVLSMLAGELALLLLTIGRLVHLGLKAAPAPLPEHATANEWTHTKSSSDDAGDQ